LSFSLSVAEREFFIDNLLVRMHLIIVMIRWTGLAPWGFESPFPGSLTSTFGRYNFFIGKGCPGGPPDWVIQKIFIDNLY